MFINIKTRIGRRGSFLIFLALLDFVYAYSLGFPAPSYISGPTVKFLSSLFPLTFWATLWAIAGCSCLFFSVRKRDAPGYAVAMFIKMLWAVIFLLGWLFMGVERAYLSTAIWGAFAAVVGIISSWPDPSKYSKEL